MTHTEVLRQLETLGSEQTRKTYRRHGVGANVYGVSYADFKKLVKKIKVNHELAVALWGSGNHDARILATMVADPSQVDSMLADAWVQDLDNYPITDAVAGLFGQSAICQSKMEKWTNSKNEWIGRTGWKLLAHLAAASNDLSDEYFAGYLETIERDIHSSLNRVKDAMNSALISIGVRNARLMALALAAAERIGKVKVDHGDTSCKTPDAAAYIRKVLARKRSS
jgi:3-methyladenine DNA glycosylase AlkD